MRQAANQPESPPALGPHSDRQAALAWLHARINYERTGVPYQSRQLKLDRMRQLLTRLGQPDVGMKIIHVAGTKGKGSTSAMIAGMLTAAGYRTGLFSSPHLESIEERFVVDGQPCTADELVTLIDRLKPVVRAMDEEAAVDGDSTADQPISRSRLRWHCCISSSEKRMPSSSKLASAGDWIRLMSACPP